MGTRADFYIGRDKNAEWLGSIAWDGYPGGIPDDIKFADSEIEYRNQVGAFLADRDDATLSGAGWPWPWSDSDTSDFAYAHSDGCTWHTIYPNKWWRCTDGDIPDDDDENFDEIMSLLDSTNFPDMTSRQNVTLGAGSGILVFSTTS